MQGFLALLVVARNTLSYDQQLLGSALLHCHVSGTPVICLGYWLCEQESCSTIMGRLRHNRRRKSE